MIAAGQLVTRDPIPVRTVYHHQPSLLAQFDRHVNRANMATDGCANVGCMHLTSPMVRVWKPKPIGCTPIAPWHLRAERRGDLEAAGRVRHDAARADGARPACRRDDPAEREEVQRDVA